MCSNFLQWDTKKKKKNFARLAEILACKCVSCNVDSTRSQSKDKLAPSRSKQSLDWPLLRIPAPLHRRDIMGFQRKIDFCRHCSAPRHFPRVVDENHQQSCVWIQPPSAKWTERGPLKVHVKMIVRATWRIWAKYSEKHFGKWGAARLTVPLINMSTLTVRSIGSPGLHIVLLAHRCELSPFSTQAGTCLNSPSKWGQMCRCVYANVCVCVAFM